MTECRAAGIYRLREPVMITGEMGFRSVSISGCSREDTVICGSIVVEAKWEKDRDGIFCARIEKNLDIDMLYVNGSEYHMARYPKYDENVRILQSGSLRRVTLFWVLTGRISAMWRS